MSVGVVFAVGLQAPSPTRRRPSADSPPGRAMASNDRQVSRAYRRSVSRAPRSSTGGSGDAARPRSADDATRNAASEQNSGDASANRRRRYMKQSSQETDHFGTLGRPPLVGSRGIARAAAGVAH